MKVKELLKTLQDFDPNAEVVMQKDSEGNGYSPLRGIDLDSVYVPDSTWSGNVYPMEWTAEDAGMNKADWNKIKRKPRCVVLYPVN